MEINMMKYPLPFDPWASTDPHGDIKAYLLSHSEEKFGDFQAKLMPTIPRERVLGVRTPVLRKFAKALYGTPTAEMFMATLPHPTFEENNLHAFLIGECQSFDTAMTALEAFLPYIDNWATCDQMSPKVLGRDLDRLEIHIRRWLASSHVYTLRYAMGMLMRYFLGDKFSLVYADMVAEVVWRPSPKDYYLDMMGAWYFATALAFNPHDVLPYITEHRLPAFVHNKTIQKAIESYRIPAEWKVMLKSFKRG